MRKNNQQLIPADSAEVNLVMLFMKGNTATLTKSIESLVTTIQAKNGYVVGATLATPRPPAALPATNGTDEEDAARPDQQLTLDEIQTPSPPATTTPRPPKNRTPPKPAKILDELNAHVEPDGFKSFVGARTVTGDTKRGLVAAKWLTDHGHSHFTVDHINTCFAMMDWPMPADPGQVLRNMSKQKVELLRHVDGKSGFYELTGKGVRKYADIT